MDAAIFFYNLYYIYLIRTVMLQHVNLVKYLIIWYYVQINFSC